MATATSTWYFRESLPLTAVFVAQLPARTISEGGSNATFQLVSSVGNGVGYGTAMPFFRRLLEATRGCSGVFEGSEVRNVWRDRRKRSSAAKR